MLSLHMSYGFFPGEEFGLTFRIASNRARTCFKPSMVEDVVCFGTSVLCQIFVAVLAIGAHLLAVVLVEIAV